MDMGNYLVIPVKIYGELIGLKNAEDSDISSAAKRALDFILEHHASVRCRVTSNKENQEIQNSGFLDTDLKNDGWIKATVLYLIKKNPSSKVYGFSLDKDVIIHLLSEDISLLFTRKDISDGDRSEISNKADEHFTKLVESDSCGSKARPYLLNLNSRDPTTQTDSRCVSRLPLPMDQNSSASETPDPLPERFYTFAQRGDIRNLSEELSEDINSNLDLNQPSKNGSMFKSWTMLHRASFAGELEMVNFLLERGCSISPENSKGDTAESLARKKGHLNIAERLRIHSLPTPSPDPLPERFYTFAQRGDIRNLSEELSEDINSNLDLNQPSKNGSMFKSWTMLHRASFAGELEMVNFLLERGCSISPENSKGDTAESLARKKGHMNIAEHLARITDS